MKNMPHIGPSRCSRLALLGLALAAVAMHAPHAVAQSAPGGTITGATTKDDVGGQARSITDLERERAKEAAKAKAVKPAARSRDDVFKAGIRDAQEAMTAGKYADALARLDQLEAIGDKTADEAYLIARTRVAVASKAGNEPLLVSSLEAAMGMTQMPAAERIEFGDLLVRKYFNGKAYAKVIAAAQRYFADGGREPAIRRAQIMAYYLDGQFALAAQEVVRDIQAAESAGNKPSEEQLRVLLSCAQKLDDKAAYAAAAAKFNAYYPKTGQAGATNAAGK